MTTGLHQKLDPAYGPRHEPENVVIGIVSSKSFGDFDFIEKTIVDGMKAHPTAVWVRGETDRITEGIFARLNLEHVAVPLNPYWKSGTYDGRRTMRDVEMLKCDHLLVFQKPGAASDWTNRAALGVHASLRLVEHGAIRERKRRGRRVEA